MINSRWQDKRGERRKREEEERGRDTEGVDGTTSPLQSTLLLVVKITVWLESDEHHVLLIALYYLGVCAALQFIPYLIEQQLLMIQ